MIFVALTWKLIDPMLVLLLFHDNMASTLSWHLICIPFAFIRRDAALGIDPAGFLDFSLVSGHGNKLSIGTLIMGRIVMTCISRSRYFQNCPWVF